LQAGYKKNTRALANIGRNFALVEAVRGSAPDIAGKQMANPCSMILSSKVVLDYLGEKEGDPKWKNAANLIERSLINTLERGITTSDLGGTSRTAEVGEAIAEGIIEG
jgi:3-isopropylmalate dehydrogenase